MSHPVDCKDAKVQSDQNTANARSCSQASELVELSEARELFCSHDGEAYVTLKQNGHRETWPLESKTFQHYLAHKYYGRYGRAPTKNAIDEALRILSGKARFAGSQQPVALRLAQENDRIYLDLCNAHWQAIEITATGWHVIKDPPVRFVRRPGMLALPNPAPDGEVDELWSLLNLTDRQARVLVVAWLIAALRPTGPYPILALQGEQGTAKSTTARMLQALVDPSKPAIRTPPRNETDLVIAARNRWVIALDNLSGLHPWLSDALCRLATGGGFATRQLYTDVDEVLIEVQRPCILNGIDHICTRQDLMDRAIILNLEPIPETARKPEAELWQTFERSRPAILGALLDAVVIALQRLPGVQLDRLPRMADFAKWVTAAEPTLGWKDGTFIAAYSHSRQSALEDALEGSPIASTLRKLMDKDEPWQGTATELLACLNQLQKASQPNSWPRTPYTLSSELKRIAPALRSIGIDIERRRYPHRRLITIRRVGNASSYASCASADAPAGPYPRDACMSIDDDRRLRSDPNPELSGNSAGDADDGNDAERTEDSPRFQE